jgi:DNA processing protein
MDNLFSGSAGAPPRAIAPQLELGAYEALWMREHTSFGSLARLFRAHPGALPSQFVPRGEAERCARIALELAAAAHLEGLGLCLHGMASYPARLRDARSPVELLYHLGDLSLLGRRLIALVGTRRPSRAGERRAAQLARHFARAGFGVLSGLARGIDTAAHRAAIGAGGVTAAVLGTPLTACYPPDNQSLQQHLGQEFLLVSQVPIIRYSHQPPPANRRFFRERNATLAALAEATIIVEAGDQSGALIAARQALLQGRQLFIPEECCEDPHLTWPARLLRSGATAVHGPADIEAHLAA